MARSVGKALGRKNTASDTRKISGLGLCVGIFFRVADYGIATDLHTGINGTVVVVGVQCLFALFFGCWDSSLPPQERGWQCAVARWQKQRKKYDSCKSVAMP